MCVLVVARCAAAAAKPGDTIKMVEPPPPLMLPLRLEAVEDGLFVSGYPTLRSFRFMRRLGLRTVVSLVPKPPTRDLERFCAAEGVELLHVAAAKYEGEGPCPLSSAGAVAFLEAAARPDRLPLLVHCLDGRGASAVAVACLRKLQMWSMDAALDEFARRSGAPAEPEIVAFLDSMAGPVDVPEEGAPWLWLAGGGRPERHPTVSMSVDGRPTSPDPEREDEERRERAYLARRADLERSRRQRGLVGLMVPDDVLRSYSGEAAAAAAAGGGVGGGGGGSRGPRGVIPRGMVSAGVSALSLESADAAAELQRKLSAVEDSWR